MQGNDPLGKKALRVTRRKKQQTFVKYDLTGDGGTSLGPVFISERLIQVAGPFYASRLGMTIDPRGAIIRDLAIHADRIWRAGMQFQSQRKNVPQAEHFLLGDNGKRLPMYVVAFKNQVLADSEEFFAFT